MSYETILVDVDDRNVATVTLNRPDKHNAMSAALIAELSDAATKLAADKRLRAVVLTGAGESFCAGGDLRWMEAQFKADRATRIAEARALAKMLGALNTLPQPVIGRVNGQAYGGGMGLMSICDVAIGADHAKFGFTETRLGLIPATISPYVIARMGEAMARRVFMSARLFGAAEAKTLGLLASVAPADDLDAAVEAEIKPYFSAAPGAVARSKKLARMWGPEITSIKIEATVEALADAWDDAEAHEGVGAFFDKRKPAWKA